MLSPMVAIRDDPRSMWRSAREGMRLAAQRIAEVVSTSRPDLDVSEGALLAEFTAAARRAASPSEALQTALARLCERIGAQSAILLEARPRLSA
jgi:hypothetical protein